MEEKEKEFEEQLAKATVDVKFLNSIALAVNDLDDNVRHVQITLVQETGSKLIRAFMDVVDPSQIKLQDVSEPNNPA